MTDQPGPPEPDPAGSEDGYPAYYPPGEAPITPWDPRRNAPSGKAPGPSRGAVAFGLALLPFLVTNLVSLWLATTALMRSRRDPASAAAVGTGFAVLATAVDVLVIAAWLLVALELIG